MNIHSTPTETTLQLNGHPARVWELGAGEPVGVLGGVIGFPRWTPFLAALAESRRVIVPSLPGFPGAEGQDDLDAPVDWLTATQDLLEAAGLAGADLVGLSVGGALAAEVAAAGGAAAVGRLVLVSPFGLQDDAEPVANLWAARTSDVYGSLTASRDVLNEVLAVPAGEDPVEWEVATQRSLSSGARLFWPMCDNRFGRRIHRVVQPTLVVWGEDDRVIPASYAGRWAAGVAGETTIEIVPGAGHLVDLDAPEVLANTVLRFLDGVDSRAPGMHLTGAR